MYGRKIDFEEWITSECEWGDGVVFSTFAEHAFAEAVHARSLGLKGTYATNRWVEGMRSRGWTVNPIRSKKSKITLTGKPKTPKLLLEGYKFGVE